MFRDVNRARRAYRLRRLAGMVAAVGLLTAILVAPAAAISGTLGGQLFWNGGTVTVQVQYAEASYDSRLYLYPDYTDAAPDFFGAIFIAENCNTSQAECDLIPPITVAIPPSLTAGDELVFGIEVDQTDQRFLMGPGTRNLDTLAHATVTQIGTDAAQVGFEDIYGGGDGDFDDNVFNFTAVIVNQPPTADAGPDVSGQEGSAIALAGSGGGADAGETLTYSWASVAGGDVDAGGACSFAPTDAAATSITCTDDGTYTATLSVSDGTYTTTSDAIVTVGNANPIVAAAFAGAISCGGTAGLTVSFTDAGANDTHSASVDWGDGSAAEPVAPITSGAVLTHAYALAGTYNATVTVTDDDLGAGSDASNSVALNYTVVGGGVQQPINQSGPISVFKSQSTIPVKIAYLDCDGSPAKGLAPTISIQKLSGSVPSGTDEPIVSTSNADTGSTMRASGNGYIYNLAAQSLTDPSATYRLTITVPATGQTTSVDIGLKP